MPKFIATLRAVYEADDEVEAIYISEQIRDNGAKDLEEEEEDSLQVTQVTNNVLDISPQEVIDQLRKSRNLLIRTRVRTGLEIAQQLDKFLYALVRHEDPTYTDSSYSYGDFMALVGRILKGEEPTDE